MVVKSQRSQAHEQQPRLYTRVINTLSPLVSVAHVAHLSNWVWIVVGILQANSIALSQIATHIPGEAKAESRVTTIRRWLKNFRVDVWELYRPVLEQALQGWHWREYTERIESLSHRVIE